MLAGRQKKLICGRRTAEIETFFDGGEIDLENLTEKRGRERRMRRMGKRGGN